MEPTLDRIPVGIITGFLGAGKTTLLNNLIREYRDKRFAIIENEFGEIGLDSELVLNVDNSNIFELANGCICCSLKDDLADLLTDLRRTGIPFDYLLIETTGVADPASVIQPFFSDREMLSAFTMDAVICLVDALYVNPFSGQHNEVFRQIALADIILLNKSKDVDDLTLARTREKIRTINPQAEILPTHHAGIKDLQILDRHAYRTEKIATFITLDGEPGDPARSQTMGPERLIKVRDARIDHSIMSHSMCFRGDFDMDRFSYWIEYFLYIHQANIPRIKGILSFAGNPQKMVLQTVRSSFLLEEWEFWEMGEKRINRMIFIGSEIPGTEIREALESLMV